MAPYWSVCGHLATLDTGQWTVAYWVFDDRLSVFVGSSNEVIDCNFLFHFYPLHGVHFVMNLARWTVACWDRDINFDSSSELDLLTMFSLFGSKFETVEVEQDKGACQSPSEAVKKGDKSKEVEVDQSPVSGPAKAAGKQGKDTSQASDGPKDEYIHVRARRGQATNSHSLAERVRREKISERMKFLQDLVPGCSKVTGKAVMLDEIINYVQSLQRQVEFLSMKLATVNPTLDFNIEGLLAKEILHSRGGQSSLGFSPDLAMAHNQLHPSQQSLIHAGISGLGTTSEALRTTINSQLTPMTGAFKELPLQLHNAWDDELHNVVQMNFGATASFNSQDLNGSLPPGRMKVEL